MRDLDTPTLVADLDIMERNIERLVGVIVRDAGVQWRPHTKAMKSPAIARKLLAAGASGITCAKLGEAEVMAAAGIDDILIANQIVGPTKIARLVALRQTADVMVAVDAVANIEMLGAAASAAGVEVRVVVEVDVGMGRAGVPPGAAPVDLARVIDDTSGVLFAGLFTWESHALGVTDPDEKRRTVQEALARVESTADQCRDAGIPVFEKNFSLLETYGADEAFVTGTFGAQTPVTEIDGRVIGDGKPGPLFWRVRELYKGLVARDVA